MGVPLYKKSDAVELARVNSKVFPKYRWTVKVIHGRNGVDYYTVNAHDKRTVVK